MEVYGQWGAWQLPHPAEGSAQSMGGGETEKAECSTALRGSRGKYKLASLAYFAQFFLLCSSPLLHSVVGAATAKAWEHRKSKPEASMGIVGLP